MERRIVAYGLACILAATAHAQIYKDIIVLPSGSLTWRTSDDAQGFTLTAPSMAASLTYSLPGAGGSTGDCLKITGTNALGFGACGSSSGWSLTGDELSPVETSATLDIVRTTDGQAIGSLPKPWNGVRSKTFQIPFADGLSARVNMTSTALTGYDAAGTQKLSLSFLSGVIDTKNTVIVRGAVGADTDTLQVLKDASLGSSNWRWSLSHRADGRQFWIYGYDGTNFTIPLKLNPTGNSVCVNCSGDATAGYSLDVGGQVLSTGYRASGAGGYVNAPQVEVRDNATGLHFGFNAAIALIAGIPGSARYVTIQDASSNPIMRWYSHVVGTAEPRVQVYGDLRPDQDTLRKLGAAGARWSEGHINALYVDQVLPRSGTTRIDLGADLYPTATLKIGHSLSRVNEVWVTNLNVSGTCTGCGGGSSKWTESGSTLYPNTTTLDYEVRPNPANRQLLGGFTAPWGGVYTRGVSITNTGNTFLRVNMSQGGIDFTNSSGQQSIVVDGGFASIDVQGSSAAYRLASTSGGSTVFSATTSAIKHTALAGSGNASACIDSTGQIYRGSPGC